MGYVYYERTKNPKAYENRLTQYEKEKMLLNKKGLDPEQYHQELLKLIKKHDV